MINNRITYIAAASITAFIVVLSSFPIPFLYGIELQLFTAVSWFIYYRYSLNHALLLTIIGSTCGIFLWDQSPLYALYPIELLLVGWIAAKSNRSAVFWDTIYWLTFGLAASFFAYQWLTGWTDTNTTTFLVFAIANGLMNIFFGQLAAEYLPDWRSKNAKKWRIGRITYHLCLVLLIAPTLIYLLISGYFTYQRSLAEITTRLDTIYGHVNEELNNLSETELRNLKVRSTVEKAALQDMFMNLTANTDVTLTLIDANREVITTLEPVLTDQTIYDWQVGGTLTQASHSLYIWQPDDIPSHLKIHRWSNSDFVSVYTFDRLPYSLIAKQPATSYQQNMFNLYVISVLLVSISTLISASVAYLITTRLSKSITQLGEFTTGLPHRIRLRESITWTDSPLYEVQLISKNFEDMTRELANMFHEINESEEKLRIMVHYDTLTGLGNRYSFNLYLPSLIQKAKENNEKIACLFIDLDFFKSINDTYGHEAGDAVLKEVGARLSRYNTGQTRAFRLSGDEFVVVINEPLPHDLGQWAQTIHDDLRDAVVTIHDEHIEVKLSAGVSLYPDHGDDAESLLRSSDHAMYEAKLSGRNQVRHSSGKNSVFPRGGTLR